MIYFVPDENSNTQVKDFLDANLYEYKIWDEWDFSQGISRLVLPKGKFLLVLPYRVLYNLDIATLRHDIQQSDGAVYFCNELDNTCEYLRFREQLLDLENIKLHQDAVLHCQDDRTVSSSIFTFAQYCLPQQRIFTNQIRKRDFVFTCITKWLPRQKLVNALLEKNLLENYAGQYHNNDNTETWSGLLCYKEWPVGSISWDLYDQSYYELVPESLYDHASLFTEKTFKSMVAKIPFVTLSDYKFYDTLHEYGFETFSGLIDESFSKEPELDKRIELLTNTMLDIDPQEFYEQSRDICEHNYDNLCVQNFRSKQMFNTQLHEFFSKKG